MCSSERHKLVWFILPHTNGIWTKFGSIGFQILWSYDGNLDSIAFQKLKIRQFSQCIKNLCRIFTTIPLHTKMEEEEGDSWSNPPVKTLIALQVLFCLANWTLIFFLSSLWKSLSSDQSLSHTRLFETPWTAVHQASLSIINSWSLLKLMSITSVMPSNLDRERQTLYDITYMWHLKNNTNEYINKTKTHLKIYKTNEWWPNGRRQKEGQMRGMGLRDTNYYV